jgi:hypothetical protein
VRARLKWQGEKGLETLFPPKRKEATIEEWYAFLNSCNCLLDEAIDRPLRSRMAVHNDLVAILLETVDVSGFKVLKASSREDMALALSKVLSSRVVAGSILALLLDRLLSAVAQARGTSRRVLKEEHQSIRQTARRLRAITSKLPNELLRDVRVFSQPARIDGLNDVTTTACDS